MSDPELNEGRRKNMLLDIIQSYADTDTERDYVYDMRRQPDTTVKDCVMALSDGIMYGNWPWITYTKPTITSKTKIVIVGNDLIPPDLTKNSSFNKK